jgi:hypothetical protein
MVAQERPSLNGRSKRGRAPVRARHRLAVLLAAIAAATWASVAGIAGPAAADNGFCDTGPVWEGGEFCVFSNSGYGGGFRDMSYTVGNYQDHYYPNTGARMNDTVSSGSNFITNATTYLHEHASSGGRALPFLPKGQCNSSLCFSYSHVGWMNDRGSSHRFG